MTDTDLALLSQRLDLWTLVDLHTLDDADLPWLPPLRVFSRRQALREILKGVQATRSEKERLQRVAFLHCWFLQRHHVSPWTLFRYKRSSLLNEFSKMLERLTSVLGSRGQDAEYASILDGGTLYACLLTRDFYRGFECHIEHQVTFMALWPGLPLLAVHVLEDRTRRTVLHALRAVLGREPIELPTIPPRGLGATLHAGFPHLSLQVGESTLNFPKVASLSDEPSPQGDEEKQRLEEWTAALADLGPSLCTANDKYTLTDASGTWVHFEGPDVLGKLRKLYVNGAREIISKEMKPFFLGEHCHVVERANK